MSSPQVKIYVLVFSGNDYSVLDIVSASGASLCQTSM